MSRGQVVVIYFHEADIHVCFFKHIILCMFNYALWDGNIAIKLSRTIPLKARREGQSEVLQITFCSWGGPRLCCTTHHPESEESKGEELRVREWWSPWMAPILDKLLVWRGPLSESLYWDTATPGNVNKWNPITICHVLVGIFGYCFFFFSKG